MVGGYRSDRSGVPDLAEAQRGTLTLLGTQFSPIARRLNIGGCCRMAREGVQPHRAGLKTPR